MKYEQLKLENQICHRLYTASNGITRLYRPLLTELGITYPQYIVFLALWEQDEISLGELSKRTSIDKGFLTTTIKKLISLKLLILIENENDLRSKNVKLTKKGLKLKESAKCIPHSILMELTDEYFDENEIEIFIKVLDQINNKIKNI